MRRMIKSAWSLMGGASYVGERAGAVDASGLRLPGHCKVKPAVDYDLNTTQTARIEVDNLLDEDYAASSYSPLWISRGAPRSVRFSPSMRVSAVSPCESRTGSAVEVDANPAECC